MALDETVAEPTSPDGNIPNLRGRGVSFADFANAATAHETLHNPDSSSSTAIEDANSAGGLRLGSADVVTPTPVNPFTTMGPKQTLAAAHPVTRRSSSWSTGTARGSIAELTSTTPGHGVTVGDSTAAAGVLHSLNLDSSDFFEHYSASRVHWFCKSMPSDSKDGQVTIYFLPKNSVALARASHWFRLTIRRGPARPRKQPKPSAKESDGPAPEKEADDPLKMDPYALPLVEYQLALVKAHWTWVIADEDTSDLQLPKILPPTKTSSVSVVSSEEFDQRFLSRKVDADSLKAAGDVFEPSAAAKAAVASLEGLQLPERPKDVAGASPPSTARELQNFRGLLKSASHMGNRNLQLLETRVWHQTQKESYLLPRLRALKMNPRPDFLPS